VCDQSGWFHHDRGPIGFEGASIDRPTFIQGVVNLLPTHPGSGGNVVLPRSHLMYAQLVEQLGVEDSRGGGRLSMPEDYEAELVRQQPELFAGAIVAHLEAGDLFLWCENDLVRSISALKNDGVPR
jgi:hypothetical protein